MMHRWVYRNPYDRTCQACGQHEMSFCPSMEQWNNSWWEVWNDGDGSCSVTLRRRLLAFTIISIIIIVTLLLASCGGSSGAPSGQGDKPVGDSSTVQQSKE